MKNRSLVHLFLCLGIFAVLTFIFACGDDDTDGQTAIGQNEAIESNAFILTTDYQSGSYALIDPLNYESSISGEPLFSDAFAKAHGNYIYVLNRLGRDNIEVISVKDEFSVVSQFSTGGGSNPYDIYFCSDEKAYVSLYDRNYVLVVDPRDGTELGRIDLSEYADADKVPEAAYFATAGGRVFLVLQRLNRNELLFPPADYALILELDPVKDKVLASIRLQSTDPLTSPVASYDGKRLFVPTVGVLRTTNDGGIEIVNLETNKSEGMLVTGEEVGGDIVSFDVADEERAFAAIYDADENMKLVEVLLKTGEVKELYKTEGYSMGAITWHKKSETLWLSDRTLEEPGVRVFKAPDFKEITKGIIPVGLPPNQILFFPE